MTENESKQGQSIKSGGAYGGKNVNTGGGNFVGRDQVSKRGDVITTTIGDNTRNVAAGKNITQINQQLSPVATAEQGAIAAKFVQIQQLFQMIKSELPGALVPVIEAQLHLLQAELIKTADDEHSSAAAITATINLLLDTVPALKLPLQELLALPTVQRVLIKAR